MRLPSPYMIIASRKVLALLLVGALALGLVAGYLASQRVTTPARAATASDRHIVYNLQLPNGQTAAVFSDGLAEIWSPGHRSVEYRYLPGAAGLLPF